MLKGTAACLHIFCRSCVGRGLTTHTCHGSQRKRQRADANRKSAGIDEHIRRRQVSKAISAKGVYARNGASGRRFQRPSTAWRRRGLVHPHDWRRRVKLAPGSVTRRKPARDRQGARRGACDGCREGRQRGWVDAPRVGVERDGAGRDEGDRVAVFDASLTAPMALRLRRALRGRPASFPRHPSRIWGELRA